MQALEPRVTNAMNAFLEKEFSKEEVDEALKMMGFLKTPRPDGFGACFYQSFWHGVGDDVSKAILDFFNGGRLEQSLNWTFIALILKVNDPKSVNEFRLISLYNVLYRIIAKTLGNRLNKVLDEVISKSQSAFIRGRLISNNIIAAYEILHTRKTRQKDKVVSMAIKLDISKAYNRVEWGYLETAMRKMGFEDKWTRLIMQRIS